MTDLQNPVLHVVYAGFGDSLLLEYTIEEPANPPTNPQVKRHRRVAVLDGGPRKDQRGTIYLPYAKYFVSSAEDVWKKARAATSTVGAKALGFQEMEQLFAPSAIYISHPHNDHFGGTLAMLDSSLPTPPVQTNTPPPAMKFTGPILVPLTFNKADVAPPDWRSSYQAIYTVLKKKGFQERIPSATLALSKVEGLSIDYPTETRTVQKATGPVVEEMMVEFAQPSTGLPGLKDIGNANDWDTPDKSLWPPNEPPTTPKSLERVFIMKGGIDDSPENISSLLVSTDKAKVHGSVLGTGDGVGWRIAETWFGQNSNKKDVDIFKIPHHGSLKNNQLRREHNEIQAHIALEYSLRELMERVWGSQLDQSTAPKIPKSRRDVDYAREDVGDTYSFIGAFSRAVKNTLAVHNQVKPLRYLRHLRARHQRYIAYFSSTTPSPGKTYNESDVSGLTDGGYTLAPRAVLEQTLKDIRNSSLITLKATTEYKYTPSDQALEVKLYPFYKYVRRQNNQAEDEDLLVACDAYVKWHHMAFTAGTTQQRKWLSLYSSLVTIGHTAQFYRSFEANAYVASANGTHKHPSPSVIVGIAVAADNRGKKTLYVTSGHAINAKALRILSKYVDYGKKPVRKLFVPRKDNPNADGLRVRYLSKSVYMSLPAYPAMPPDQNDATDAFELSGTNGDGIYRALEDDRSVLPQRTTRTPAYRICGRVHGITQFEWDMKTENDMLGRPVFEPNLVKVPNPPNYRPAVFTVQEEWQSGQSSSSKRIRVSVQQGQNQPQFLELEWAERGVFLLSSRRFSMGNVPYWVTLFFNVKESKPCWLEKNEVDSWRAGLPGSKDIAPMGFTFIPSAHQNFADNMLVAQSFSMMSINDAQTRIQEPSLEPLEPPGPVPQPLRRYLESAKISIDLQKQTLTTVLAALIGASNIAALDLTRPAESKALRLHVDADASTVSFEDKGINFIVHGARIVLHAFIETTLTLNEDVLAISGGELLLDWPPGHDLTASTTVSLARDSVSIKSTRKVDASKARRSTSMISLLARLYAEAGTEVPDLTKLTLSTLVGFLTDRSPQAVANYYAGRVPAILIDRGFISAEIDLHRSTAEVWTLPTGTLMVDRAEFICKSSFLDATKEALVIADLDIKLGDITVVLEQARRPGERMTLYTDITLPSGVTLASSVLMSESNAQDGSVPAVQWQFSMATGKSIDELKTLWPETYSADNTAKAPFCESTPLMALDHSKIGFILAQDVTNSPSYRLASVYAAVNLADWKKFLPSGLPINNEVTPAFRVEIKNPFDSKFRAYGASVRFGVTVKTDNGSSSSNLAIALVAEPLPVAHTYDYRLHVSSSARGVTMLEVAEAMGIGTVAGKVADAIPLLSQVLHALRLKRLITTLHKGEDGAFSISEFGFCVTADNLEITKALVVNELEVDLDYFRGGWEGSIRGAVTLASKRINAEIVLPQKDSMGKVTIDIPDKISVHDLLDSIRDDYPLVPDIMDLPLLGTLLRVGLHRASIGLAQSAEGKTVISGGEVEFTLAELALGKIHLAELTLAIQFRRYRVDPKSVVSFSVTAQDAAGDYSVSLSYSNLGRTLVGTFHTAGVHSVAKSLEYFLGPGVFPDVVHGLMGEMGIAWVGIVANLKTFTPDALSVYLQNTAELKVDQVALQSLNVTYLAGIKKEGGIDGKPLVWDVVGITRGPKASAQFRLSFIRDNNVSQSLVKVSVNALDNDRLTLDGILSLLSWTQPDLQRPEGVKDVKFFELDIHEISGEVLLIRSGDEPKSITKMQLKSLDIDVESQNSLQLLPDPAISLEKIGVKVHYRKGDEGKPDDLHALLWGKIRIQENITIDVKYTEDKGNGVTMKKYSGSLKKSDKTEASPTPEYRSLAEKYLKSDDYSIPTDLDIPNTIPMAVLNLEYTPNASFELSGFTSGLNWPIKGPLGDLSMNVNDLGGHIVLDLTAAKRHRAILFGALSFSSFTSTTLTVLLQSKKRPLLLATLKRSSTDKNDITGITSALTNETQGLSSLLPKDTNQASFHDASIGLLVDFETSTFLLSGEITGVGSGFLLAKRDPQTGTGESKGKYSYVFFLGVRDIISLWPTLQDSLGRWFKFEALIALFSTTPISSNMLHAGLKQMTETARTEKALPETTRPKEMDHLPSDFNIPAGAYLYAVISLQPGNPLSEMLSLSVREGCKPTITLSAEVPRDEPKNAHYLVRLRDFEFLGGAITVRKAEGSYNGANHLIVVKGGLEFKLGSDEAIKFQVEFHTNDTTTGFDIKDLNQGPLIKNAFGGVFGLTFNITHFSGSVTKPVSNSSGKPNAPVLTCELHGTVRIAGKDLLTSILFKRGAPVLFKIETKDPISVDKIVSDIINGASAEKTAEWPADYGEVLLEKVILYYSAQKDKLILDGDMTEYQPGFNIVAHLRLFDYVFGITAHLPGDGTGIMIEGVCNDEVELGFAQLISADPVPTGGPRGPKLSIHSLKQKSGNVRVYEASTGIRLLGKTGFQVKLQHEGKKYSGTASYTGEPIPILGQLGNPSVTITYDNGRWSVGGLKAMQIFDDKAFSIKDALEKGSKKNRPECKDLVGLILDKLLKTKFDYDVKLAGYDSKTKAVKVGITGTFQVELEVPIIGETSTLAKLDIPTIQEVPLTNFTFEALVERLGKAMVDCIGDIGAAILDKPDQATLLLGWMTGKSWVAKIISALLCRRIQPAPLYRRAYELRPGNDPKSPDDPDSTWKEILTLVLEIGLAIVISEAIPGLVALYSAYKRFRALAGPLRSMFRSIVNSLSKTPWAAETASIDFGGGATLENFIKESAKLETSLAEGAKQLVNARQTIRTGLNLSAKPHARAVVGASAVTLDWAHAVPKKQDQNQQTHDYLGQQNDKGSHKWEVVVSPSNEPPADATETPAHAYQTTGTSLTIHNREFAAAHELYVWVRVKYTQSGLTFASAQWQAADVIKQVPKISPPPSLEMRVDPAGLDCLLSLPKSEAGTFVFQLNMVTMGKVASPADVVVGPAEVTLTEAVETAWRVPISSIHWHRLLRDGSSPRWLQGQVYAKSLDRTKTRDSAVVWSRFMPVLMPPTGMTFSYSDGSLSGQWDTETGGQNSYELVFQQGASSIWSLDAPTSPFTQPTAGTPLEGKGSVEVYLRQKPPANTEIVSLFDSRYVDILDVSKPDVVASESFLDVPSSTFYISLTMKPTLSRLGVAAFIVFVPPSTTPNEAVVPPFYIAGFEAREEGDTSRVLLRVPTNELSHPLPASLQISAMNSANLQGPLSDPWTLPLSIPSELAACSPAVSFNKDDGSLTVTWVSAPPDVTRVVVDVVEHDSELKGGGVIQKEVHPNALKVCFSAAEYVFDEGQSLSVTCTSWRERDIRGAAKTVDFTIPSIVERVAC